MITYFTNNDKIYRVYDNFQLISGQDDNGEPWLNTYVKISGMQQLSEEARHIIPSRGDRLLISPKNDTDFMTSPVIEAIETSSYEPNTTASELEMSGIYTRSLYKNGMQGKSELPTNKAWCGAPDLLRIETQNTAYLCDMATGNVLAAGNVNSSTIDENESHNILGHHAYMANKQLSFITMDGAIKESSMIKKVGFAQAPVAIKTVDQETYIIDPEQHIVYGGKLPHPEHYDTLAFGDKLLVVLDEKHPGSYLLTSSIDKVQFLSMEHMKQLGTQMLDEERDKKTAADVLAHDYAKIISNTIRNYAKQRQIIQDVTNNPSFFLDPDKVQQVKTASELATAALENGKNSLWKALEVPPSPRYDDKMRAILTNSIQSAVVSVCHTDDPNELERISKAILPPIGEVYEKHNPFSEHEIR